MATITFPSNPVLNQIYSYDGNSWIWDGSSWQLLTNAALNAVVIGNVVPETGAFTDLTANTVTANSVASGTVSTGTLYANAVAGGTLSGSSLSLSGNVISQLRVQNAISGTNITAFGTISAEDGIVSFGNVSAPYFIGDGSLLTNLPSGGTNYSNANVAAYLPTYTGNLSAGNVSILGNIFGNGVSILGQVVASGNINGNNFNTTGRISAAGNVVGNYIFGNGAFLTGLNNNYGNANVAAFLPTYTGDINAGNISGSGAGLRDLPGANVAGTVANAAYATLAGSATTVAGANVAGTVASATQAVTAGTVTTAAQPNITSVGTLTSVTVSGNVVGGNLKVNAAASVLGNVTANYFIGNGALLTGLPSLNYSNANVAAYLQTANIPIRASTLSATTVSVGLVDASGNVLGGNIRSAGQVTAGTNISATGNVTGANILTAGRVSAAGNVSGAYIFGDGRFLTNVPSSYGNANVAAYLANNTGAVTGSSLNITGDITASNLYLYGEEFTTENITAFGNISGGNLNTTGWISTTGNVHAQTYFGDGSFLTGIPYNDYGNANVAAYLPTYTGLLTGTSVSVSTSVLANSLSVTGQTSFGQSVSVVGNVVAARISTSSVSATGNVVANYFVGDGSLLTNVPTNNYSNANVAAFLPVYPGALAGISVSVVGNIVGSTMSVVGQAAAGSVTAAGNVVAGALISTGSITAAGNIVSNYIFGNGRFLSGIVSDYGNANVAAYLPTNTSNVSGNNFVAAGSLTAGGNVTGTNISAAGNIAAGGNVNGANGSFTQSLASGNITSTGRISAAGNITGSYFIGNGRLLTGLDTYSNANVSAYLPTYTGTLSGDNLSVSGSVTGNGIYSFGEVFATTVVSAVGNVTGGNITTPGWVSTTGNVSARYYFGDGRFLTNVVSSYSNANVASYLASYSGNLAAGNASVAGSVTANYFVGNGSLLTGIQATVVGVLPSLSVTGNTVTGNLNTAGNVTANYFIGDGSQLTNLPSGNYSNANVAAYLPTYTGNLTPNIVSAAGNITANYFFGNGSQLTGMYSNAQVANYLPSYAGNLNPTNVVADGNITADYFIGNGALLTGIEATVVGTLGNLSVTGNIETGNLNAAAGITAIGNITTAESLIATDVLASGVVSSAGSVIAANIIGTNRISTTGTVTAGQFVGNGSQLTGIVASTVAANALTGNTLSSNVVNSSLRTVGNLNSLTVSGTTTANTITASGNIVTAQNVLATTVSALGNVTGDYILGNGSQLTGIVATSIGVLPSLSVTGNITVGPGGYYIGDGGRLSNITVSTTYSNANVAAYLPTYSGNLSAGNVNISGVYYGNGSGLRNINAGNVVGTVANATYAITAGTATTATRAATVTTNAQPNITSVGTLTSLTTSGNANIGGNISVAGNIYGTFVGNIIGNLVVPGSNTEIVFNNNGDAGTSPFFKFNSATQQLLLTGLASATGNIVTDQYFIGNGRFLTGLPEAYGNANVAAYLPTYTGNLTADIISASGNITGNYILGDASQLSNVPSVLTVSNWFNGNVISNTIANVTTLRFNGNTGITVEDLGNSEALVSLGSSFKTWEVDGQANLVAVGEDVVKFVAGPGIVITTNANAYPQEIAFAADVPNISNGTSNITVLNNSNIRVGVSGATVADFGNTGLLVTGNVSADYFVGNGAYLTGVTASNVGTLETLSVTGNVTAGGATFNGNVSIAGNLSVAGNVSYINVTDLVVGDPLIYFAANNTGNLLDIGWVGSYDDGTYQHTGLVRDHTDGVWKLFSNVAQEPTTVIDWANALYDQFQAGDISSTGNVTVDGNIAGVDIVANGIVSATGNITTTGYFIGDGSQLTNLPTSTPIGNAIELGSNSAGQLVSNAVTLTANTSVTNGLALLNQVLGKLVPPSPTNFPGATTLAISSLSTYRMANFVQTDNTPGANKNVAGGTTVTTVRRAASYSTNTVANVGPGDAGTVIAVLNGSPAGNVTLTSSLNGNGTYSNLVITNNYDYHVANSQITAGFWSVFTAQASGTVSQGWNEVYISDSSTGNTNTPSWYYDASAPGTPGIGNVTISPSTTSLTYSSTVGHYNTSTQFALGFTANRLSGDMYPTSDTFVTGSAGGAFAAPVSVTYASAGVTTPLARNLYVSSGAQSVSTTANITSGFGASSTGPSISVVNSYATGTQAFTSALGANVLYKTGTASTMEESNVVVGGTIGSGSGAAFRIVNPGSTDTPAYTGSEATFNSQSGPLQTYDATIVAAVLKHDQTNYSTGYLPAGPDLSSGRSGAQYFTFKIQRSSVSKFDVKWTGTIAGLWVALPGSLIDSTSTLNGWLDMSVAYGGAGAPGANTGAGGNGSNGCALGTVAPLNSAQTNRSITATFGTVSSTSATNNEIYIRIKLTSGQSVTALSLQPASN